MKKSRRVLMAGAAAMVFFSVVGSAAFLTLNTPRAEFLPENSVWSSSLLPAPAEQVYRRDSSASADFISMDFAAFGDAFSRSGGNGTNDLAALDSSVEGGASGLEVDSGNGNGNGGDNGGSQQTFSSTPSPWDALRSELEKSIEPGAGLGGSGGAAGRGPQLSELNPDETMTPDPTQPLQPDQQPLPERPVAEPQSWALLLLGLAGLGALRYRKTS